MKININSLFVCLSFLAMNSVLGQQASDTMATTSTEALYKALFESVKKGVLLGHQDALAYGHNWYREGGRSDVKDLIGTHPIVVGWELGDLELGHEHNLDKVYFSDIIKHVQDTYERGGLSMFSWHGNNIATGGNSWDCAQDTVVKSILPEGIYHDQYLGWLDKLGDFFLSLKDTNGDYIPVVFRPYHEHTGSWFWWGSKQCTPEQYKALWKMTIDYLQNVKQVHNVLYSYATAEVSNEKEYLERYPGDNLVDILGFDSYVPNSGDSQKDVEQYINGMTTNIDIIVNYATKSGKIASIGETGYEGIKDPNYFTEIVYPMVKDQPIAWILFWRNAYEADKRDHYYLPFKGHPAANDFKKFVKMKRILNSRL